MPCQIDKYHKPFFSIVIPSYNCEKYISRCILSLINTKFDNFEIIVVDDGSTDNTLLVCNELANKYKNIKILHQKNTGQMKARMFGVNNSTGDYICFVDSDDCVKENYFEVLTKSINSNPNADIIYFNFINFNSVVNDDLYFLEEKQYNSYEFISKIYTHNHFHSLWRACYKKRIVCIHIDDEILLLRYGEDFCSFLYFAFQSKIVKLVKNNLYIYSPNDDSLTHKMVLPNSLFNEVFKKEFIGYNILTKQFAINECFRNKYLELSLIHFIQILHYLYKSKNDFITKKKYSLLVLKEPYFKMISKKTNCLSLYNKTYLLLFKNRFFYLLNFVEKVVGFLDDESFEN